MKACKRKILNQFWLNYLSNTDKAVAFATVATVILSGVRNVFANPVKAIVHHPIMPLYVGMAGGIAFSQCATRFNELARLENELR